MTHLRRPKKGLTPRAPRAVVPMADRYVRYEQRKASFLALNPGASAEEIEMRLREIAKQEGI
jgi:hypothetical protein